MYNTSTNQRTATNLVEDGWSHGHESVKLEGVDGPVEGHAEE